MRLWLGFAAVGQNQKATKRKGGAARERDVWQMLNFPKVNEILGFRFWRTLVKNARTGKDAGAGRSKWAIPSRNAFITAKQPTRFQGRLCRSCGAMP